MISVNQLIQDMAEPLATDIQIAAISMDSRTVPTDSLFIASAKDQSMRQQHIDQAIAAGAKAIITGTEHSADVSVPLIKIAGLDQQISAIGDRFYNKPSHSMTVIAVTGTNGKTSVSQFIAQGLELSGQPCGVIGTLGQGRLSDLQDTGMTTPNPLQLQQTLAAMRDAGIRYVAIEASSHALAQGRLNAVAIDIAVLTNLSRDHLDYHGDMQSYAAAKQRLFMIPTVSTAIVNIDDAFGQALYKQQQPATLNWLSYSQQQSADWQAKNIRFDASGVHFELASKTASQVINAQLLGRFNIDNLLATAAVLSALKIPPKPIAKYLSQLQPVSGRMQLLQQANSPVVVIDYAHTPDALSHALSAMRQHLDQNADLWCVFGCGGDRDRGKRPLMGQRAEQLASHLVLTDDNPRSEASDSIIAEISAGMQQPQNATIITDRRHAIFYAVAEAANDDMVLVAGKGHENYQEILGKKQPFNDATVVQEALQARQQRSGANL
ncbi:MAG: UDP-N-acetylmuramoyl-L-alanyl-D-glutamate--2,6-diaminopimelate ligase [Methylophaga sp.]|nr:UDP-N-acetylmuramoyl-L-alanyl-D-glutamate--2,6-diaminopimelate ligase [Methylophaga sp.]